MQFLWAFLIGGAICAVCQIIYDHSRLTPGHILVGLLVTGALLSGIGVYEPLLKFAGAGALVPVSGFGHSMVTGIVAEVKRLGWEGLFTGAFELTGLGISAAVIFGTLMAILFRPRS